ncbi:hypothetical protein ACQPTN_24845 [Bradyrhizobium sp. 13971]
MSDTDVEIPRDEATGQFAGEEKFGRAAELADAGWKELPKQAEPELDVESAAQELGDTTFSVETEPAEVVLFDADALAQGELKPATDLDDPNAVKTALTPEEASRALTDWRRAEIDAVQADADAELLAELGVEPATPETAAKPDTVEQQAEPAAEHQPAAEDDGLAKALENPIIVEALKGEFARAEQARSAYAQQLDVAVNVAEAAFLSQFPEFRGVTDAGHLRSIASSIQAQNPQRWAAIEATANQASQLVAAQQQEHQAAAQREQHAVRQFNAEASRAYEAKWGKVDQATADGVRSYLQGLGATNEDFAQLLQSRVPAWAQRALVDAAALHQMRSAPLPKPSRQPLPPVQRPGAAQPRGAARASDDLRSLNAKLSATGRIEDAMALLGAMRTSDR